MTSRFFFWALAVLGSLMHLFGFLFAQVPQPPQPRHSFDPILFGILSTALLLLLGSYYFGRRTTRRIMIEGSIYKPSMVLRIALILVAAQSAICLLALITTF